jgi:hypothetical protein
MCTNQQKQILDSLHIDLFQSSSNNKKKILEVLFLINNTLMYRTQIMKGEKI